MRYISTRGQAAGPRLRRRAAGRPGRGRRAVRAGALAALLARRLRAMRGLPYAALAARVIQPFVGDAIPLRHAAPRCAATPMPASAIRRSCRWCSSTTGLFVQELFHGPTLVVQGHGAAARRPAVRSRAGGSATQRVTIVGATSGDTGSAAIEACAGRDRIDIVILHPHGRTSEVQRRQMTTVDAPNVAQRRDRGHVRRLPGPREGDVRRRAVPRSEMHLSAVNSINWARIAAQIAYYVAAGAGARRAGPRGGVQRADRQFRQRARRPGPRGGWGCRSRG